MNHTFCMRHSECIGDLSDQSNRLPSCESFAFFHQVRQRFPIDQFHGDILLAVEFAKPLVWRAAYSLTHGDPDASLHASMAKAAASDAARRAGAQALQCHGAIAYTAEYDLHLWLKRTWALVAQDGDGPYHRRRIAELLGL